MLVSTPSEAIPASSASPETPAPVPISTTARACTERARNVSIATVPVEAGVRPISRAARRARAT